jgi:hypothetical protein
MTMMAEPPVRISPEKMKKVLTLARGEIPKPAATARNGASDDIPPGLERRDDNGMHIWTWRADPKLVARGFEPKSARVWNSLNKPSATERADVEQDCARLQKQMLAFEQTLKPEPSSVIWPDADTRSKPSKQKAPTKPEPEPPPVSGPDDAKAGIRLRHFDDCSSAQAVKSWHIKYLLAENETVMLIGPPGSGKSALAGDICMAYGQENIAMWRGHRIKQHGAITYFAFERADLVERRLYAQRERDGLSGPSCISIADRIINLMAPGCVELMLNVLKDTEKRHSRRVGLAVIDTYNKGIAAGGGDEDKARDQNRALGHIRELQARYPGLAVLVIGHTGKDEARGMRGSNAAPGDGDVVLQISTSGDIKTVTTIKANDLPEGELLSFRLEKHVLDIDEDGDEVATYIVDPEMCKAKPMEIGRAGPARSVLALDRAVTEALDRGTDINPRADMPHVRAASVASVRAEFCRCYVVDTDDDPAKVTEAKRGAFRRALAKLPTKYATGSHDGKDWIWRA